MPQIGFFLHPLYSTFPFFGYFLQCFSFTPYWIHAGATECLTFQWLMLFSFLLVTSKFFSRTQICSPVSKVQRGFL